MNGHYHCQICERDIKLVKARGKVKPEVLLIAHHGYQRPYQQGWQTSSCPGARELPYERSRNAIMPYVKQLEAWKISRREFVASSMANPPDFLEESVRNMRTWQYENKRYERPEGFKHGDEAVSGYPPRSRYATTYYARLKNAEMEIAQMTMEIARLTKRHDAWVAPAEAEKV